MPKKKSAPVIPSDSQPTAQKAPDPSTILPPVDLHAMAMQGDREAQFKYGLELAPQNTLEGLSWIRKAGEQGHVMAQRVLGNCYNVGNGIPQDHVEAAKWYRKAAEQGDVEGQLMLGSYCFRGDGVPQDYAEAVKWTKKAADQGHPQAQFNFAFCYSSGHGVQQDFAEAAKWYRKSADQGNALAQDFLGQCYQLGQGVTKDDFEAYVWFLVAKANKHMKDAATKLSPQESERAIGRAKILQDEIQARQKKIQQ
jgi:TPR repeat protein